MNVKVNIIFFFKNQSFFLEKSIFSFYFVKIVEKCHIICLIISTLGRLQKDMQVIKHIETVLNCILNCYLNRQTCLECNY